MMMMSAVIWQDSLGTGTTHWLMIFVGLVALAMVVQAVSMLAMAVMAKKAKNDVLEQIAEIKAKVLPLVANSQVLITDLTPKINDISAKAAAISANVEDISALVRDKLHEFGPTITAANQTLISANETVREANETAREANQKARDQVLRVNGMVSSVLDATSEAGKAIQRGINVPVREASAIIGGVKAAFTTFVNGATRTKRPVYRAPIGVYEGSVKPDGKPGMTAD